MAGGNAKAHAVGRLVMGDEKAKAGGKISPALEAQGRHQFF
jgi:hypothetical protein